MLREVRSGISIFGDASMPAVEPESLKCRQQHGSVVRGCTSIRTTVVKLLASAPSKADPSKTEVPVAPTPPLLYEYFYELR